MVAVIATLFLSEVKRRQPARPRRDLSRTHHGNSIMSEKDPSKNVTPRGQVQNYVCTQATTRSRRAYKDLFATWRLMAWAFCSRFYFGMLAGWVAAGVLFDVLPVAQFHILLGLQRKTCFCSRFTYHLVPSAFFLSPCLPGDLCGYTSHKTVVDVEFSCVGKR